MTLQTERVRSLEEVRAFVEGSKAVDFVVSDQAVIYRLVRRTLVRLEYHRLGKAGPHSELKRLLACVIFLHHKPTLCFRKR